MHKKKNNLYNQFINNKTKIKHKMYENNLVNILHNCKQTYYNKLLEENKKSLKIINEVMRYMINGHTYLSEFTQNCIQLTNNRHCK